MNNYDWLISRLDAFIRKYYANKVIRGSLIFLICLLSYVLLVSVGEYYLYLPVWLRVAIVSVFALLGGGALVAWVVIPLSKMARLGKVISHEQAATIIGTHFPEVSDKLLNILQLRRQQQEDSFASRELIQASIEQKASQISVVPITAAVDLTRNRRYLRYLVPIVLVATGIMLVSPRVFVEASERLLSPTRTFEKPAPFRFVVTNPKLLVVRNADFVLQVEAQGNVLPAEMSVLIGGDKVPMQAMAGHKFQYVFRNVTEPVTFNLEAAGFTSKEYTLKVAQKPILKSFRIHIDYPDYTGRKDEDRNSLGDMTVPAGTTISWNFVAEHTDDARFKLGDGNAVRITGASGKFGTQHRFRNDTSYTFILSNKESAFVDSYQYNVQVIPDQFPLLQVNEYRDTVSGKQVLLSGTAGDDYGITRVLFHYAVTDKEKTLATRSIPLKVNSGALTGFQHYFDIAELDLKQGQKVTFYIEAWDNDGVNGSKASRSEMMSFQMFNAKQLDSAINENAKQINSGLSNSSEQTQKMQQELKDMQSKLLQSDKLDWQDQQNLKDMSQKQEDLKTQLENIKKRFEEQVQQSKQKQYSEAVREEQEQIKEQMENLLNNELKEMMQKLQELMQKLNKEQATQTMEQMQQENKLFDMDMKRLESLLKKLEMRMKMEDLAAKLDKMADKQLDIKENNEGNKKNNETLAKEQQALAKELEKTMKEDMKGLQEQNSDMGREKQNLDKEQQQGEQAQQEMNESEQEMNQGQKSKASQSQSKAAQNLQDMANSLRQKSGGMDAEELEIDIKMVRQVLTNLMRLSFDQEALMRKVPQTSAATQSYVANQHEQARLHANSRMIRDSLFVLSQRISKLDVAINKETTELERYMKLSVKALEDRRVSEGITRQQYAMTHVNNLALMLNEVLGSLMDAQSKAKEGEGQCNKPSSSPGGKKPKPGAGQQLSDIITKQKSLGDAMQQMQSRQGQQKQGSEGKDGEKPQQGQEGKEGQQGKQGGKQSGGEYGNAEQLARMAEQQAAIRRQLQELNSLLNSKGMGNAKEIKDIQEKMDRTETDLVNRRLTNELVQRQKDILTRLLETEKSLREQEQDDKRSSQSATEVSRPIPAELQRYMQEKQRLLDFYRTVPPQLKPYYRTMVQNYYQAIGK
ncbi:MAG: DUF4175 family protein [Flavipsychrobacter sp.]|nr:DUF4175 family protein [Flavipsychrobacter sp.]